jgi:hypothetical protein
MRIISLFASTVAYLAVSIYKKNFVPIGGEVFVFHVPYSGIPALSSRLIDAPEPKPPEGGAIPPDAAIPYRAVPVVAHIHAE